MKELTMSKTNMKGNEVETKQIQEMQLKNTKQQITWRKNKQSGKD